MKPLIKVMLLFCMYSFGMMSAQNATVQIEVKEKGEFIVPFTLIELKSPDTGETIDGQLSDENGKGTLVNIPPGTYQLFISQTGFEDYTDTVQISAPNTDLGTVYLTLQEEALEGLEIRSETTDYKVEIDKRVVTVGKDLVNAGAQAKDVLNNIPSLSVDGQSGELSLRGNPNVQVLVDGKPSNMPTAQLLEQLPSNAIDKIEIITNPSAKYNPEGNSGIINIITRKDKREGYNIGLVNGFTQGRESRWNHGINANFNKGKFNFFGNYNLNHGKNKFLGEIKDYSNLLNQEFDLLNDYTNHVFKVGLDWFINDKTALTIYTNQNFSDYSSINSFDIFDVTPQINYTNINDVIGDNVTSDYNLNFKRDFNKEDHYIELNSNFSVRNDSDNRLFSNKYIVVEDYEEIRDQTTYNTQINLDYVNKLKEAGKIESGLQFRQEKIDNTFNSNQASSLTDFIGIDYTRNIYSAYTNYQQKFGKFGTQVGLRIENVQEESPYTVAPNPEATYTNDYTKLYPSIFLTYDVSESTTLSVNYSKRVDRPSIYQVTPVPEWNNPLISSVGNPDLQPQFTNSFEIGALKKIKGGSINLVGFYRHINDQIFRYLEEDPNNPNATILQYINYDESDGFGVEFNFNYKLASWWRTNISFDYFNNEIVDQIGTTRANPWNTRMNNNFTINDKFNVQHFFMYRGKNRFIQGEMQSMWRMDVGASYNIWKGKGTISARMNDIFQTFFAEAHIDNPNQAIGKFRWEAQTFYIGLTLNFGGKVKTRADKQQGPSQGGNSGGGVGF